MTLAVPWALAWTALAAPIVIFYILKIRLRRVPVSTTMFWRQIFEEKPPRSLWETLKHLLSLLVQIALLLLLVFALSEPYFSWEVLAARRIVLVVDNSASLAATDVPPTRFVQAMNGGLSVIDGLRFRDEMAIVIAGAEPTVACGMTGHLRTLKTALQAIPQTDGPTHLREAVTLGRRLIGGHPHGKVVVLTDGCCAEAAELADNTDVELHLVGGRAANVGITRFQVRRSLLDSLGYEILVEVLNASDDPLECRLEIELDGVPVDVLPLKLKSGQVWGQTLEKTSLKGGHLTAKLLHADALSVDNTAWAILPARSPMSVVIVTPGNLFLQKVFEANPLMDVSVEKEIPEEVPPGTLLVLHRQAPAKLPAGAVLAVDPQGSCDLWDAGEEIAAPLITQQASDSPLMTHVRLDNVLMPPARQLKFHQPAQTLAGTLASEPIFAAMNRPAGKVLVLTADLEQGDLAFRTAFPILVSNSVSWFSGNAGELRESLNTGGTAEVDLSSPQSTSETVSYALAWTLTSPEGIQRALPAGMEKITVGPLETCGIWSLTPTMSQGADASAKPPLELACNLANAAESDLRTPDALMERDVALPLAAAWFSRPLWFYLVATAWLLAGAEWFLYQRRYLS
jgi:hypothetical protein